MLLEFYNLLVKKIYGRLVFNVINIDLFICVIK